MREFLPHLACSAFPIVMDNDFMGAVMCVGYFRGQVTEGTSALFLLSICRHDRAQRNLRKLPLGSLRLISRPNWPASKSRFHLLIPPMRADRR